MNKEYSPPLNSLLARRLFNGEFAITAEITPPVSGSAEDILSKAQGLKNVVDAVNVTDGPNANVHMSSVASSAILKANSIEPIAQFTCRDRNRIALYSDLLGLSALDVNNILILNGDDPTAGDQPEARPVFDLKSHELIHVANMMTNECIMPSKRPKANDPSNKPYTKSLTSPTKFFIGAADVPTADFSKKWARGIITKHKAGARFVQTQLCYDMDIIKSYAHLIKEEGLAEQLFFLIGNGPLISDTSAKWMRDNLWGVIIPNEILDRLKNANDSKLEGIKICSEQLQLMSEIDGIAGAHLMAPINTKSIPESIKQAKIANRTLEV